MSAISTDELLEESKCYTCLGLSVYESLALALLLRIATVSTPAAPLSYIAPALPFTYTADVKKEIEVNYRLDVAGVSQAELTIERDGLPTMTCSTSSPTADVNRIFSVHVPAGGQITLSDTSVGASSVSILVITILDA